jgi:hypothetical protein
MGKARVLAKKKYFFLDIYHALKQTQVKLKILLNHANQKPKKPNTIFIMSFFYTSTM